jgi:hypothetical protein
MVGQTSLQQPLGSMQPLLDPDIYLSPRIRLQFRLPMNSEQKMMFGMKKD